MSTPRISNSALRTVNFNNFSGGVNFHDSVSKILDNQVCDSKNVWYKDGLVKSRPGVCCVEKNSTGFAYNTSDKTVNVYKNLTMFDKGEEYFLVVERNRKSFDFKLYCANREKQSLDEMIAKFLTEEYPGLADSTLNVFQFNSDIYVFSSPLFAVSLWAATAPCALR